MTEAIRRSKRRAQGSSLASRHDESLRAASSDPATDAAASERTLARYLVWVTPIATVVAAGIVDELMSLGPALLVLAGGSLFATLAFFWASLRTMCGDAPLAEGFAEMTPRRIEASDGARERKRAALRALKDLTFEHSVGKIDDDDYQELSDRYRQQAKAILREIDQSAVPYRGRAEEIARAYLASKGPVTGKAKPAETKVSGRGRIACRKCKASNDPDAAFCRTCGISTRAKLCEGCGTLNEEDSFFCKACGRSMGGRPEEEPDVAT